MTLEHTFDSFAQLTNIQTDITGAETATLTEADYSESLTDGVYSYTGTYEPTADGDYTFTLTTAETSGGQTATWGSQSSTINFTSSTPQLIDSFEDQDFAEYTDNGTGNLTTGTTFVTDGTYGMEISRNASRDAIVSLQGSGLNYYPQPGDTWRFDYRTNAGDTLFYHGFLMQGTDTSIDQDGFLFTIEPTNNQLRLWKNWTSTTLDTAAVTINTATDYIAEVDIASSDGTITCTLYDGTGAALGSVSSTDADASSGGAYDANYGISFSQNDTGTDNGTTFIDHIRTI